MINAVDWILFLAHDTRREDENIGKRCRPLVIEIDIKLTASDGKNETM